MKKLLSIVALVGLFTACNSSNTNTATSDTIKTNTTVDSISAIKDSMGTSVKTDSSTTSVGVTADTSKLNK